MKVTFILRNVSDSWLGAVSAMSGRSGFEYLTQAAQGELSQHVTMRIGPSNSFRDRVELNQMQRGPLAITYKIEPRKGYRLATFDIHKG